MNNIITKERINELQAKIDRVIADVKFQPKKKQILGGTLPSITFDLSQLDVDFRNEKIQSDIDEQNYYSH